MRNNDTKLLEEAYSKINENVQVVKGRYLKFEDGSLTSIPSRDNASAIVGDKDGDDIYIQTSDRYGITIRSNKWDKRFASIDALVTWMNENGYTYYIGIDDE